MQLSKELFLKLKESVAFFASFSAGELLALLKIAETEAFEEEEIIFKEGTRGDKMYIILSGVVRISKYLGNKQEEILVKLQPGACFGEMGVIDQSPRSARATVDGGKAVLLSIKETLLSQHNVLLAYKLYRNFAVMLAQRLRETNDKLQSSAMEARNTSVQNKGIIKKRLDSGGSLQGVNLKGVDLSEAFMNNANLQDAILVGAILSGTKLKQTNFTNAQFLNSKLESGVFEGVNFAKANFTNAEFKNCTFSTCDFKTANFTAADLLDVDIDSSNKNPPTNKK